MEREHPAFVLHDHRKPRQHFDLRLEQGGVLRSWAVPKGMPQTPRLDRLAVAVSDHDMDHLRYEDEFKSIADIGWWEDVGSDDRRLLVVLHGLGAPVRYALINTGDDWLLHRTKDQSLTSHPADPTVDRIVGYVDRFGPGGLLGLYLFGSYTTGELQEKQRSRPPGRDPHRRSPRASADS